MATVREIALEDGTTIPLTGRWDGSIVTTQFRGMRLDMETNHQAMKLLGDRKHHIVTITCELTDVTDDYPKSWNMNVYEEE